MNGSLDDEARCAPRGPFRRAFLLGAALLASACGGNEPASVAVETPSSGDVTAVRTPDVLLISLDTLRADRLSCYGYERATTPTIDALAARGLRFAHCIAPAPHTAPSHMSLFTGLYPLAHGVENASAGADDLTRVNDAVPMLAELLSEAGFQTMSMRESGQMTPRMGFDRGIDQSSETIGFQSVIESTAAALEKVDADRPLFAFVHTYEPHAPYLPPKRHGGVQYFGRFTDPNYTGEFRDRYEALVAKGNRSTTGARDFLRPFEGITPDDFRWLSDLYDENVAWTDASLAVLLDLWQSKRDMGNTIVILVSDHGEQLGEHGWLGHGSGVFQELARIPFVMVIPGGPQGTVETPVGLASVPATLLDVLDIEAGPAMQPSVLGLAKKAAVRDGVSFMFDPPSETYSAMTRETQLILRRPPNDPEAGYDAFQVQSYDLRENPFAAPTKNKDHAEWLRPHLLGRVGADLALAKRFPMNGIKREMDDATRARLEELGYVDWRDAKAERKSGAGGNSKRDDK